MRYDQRNRGKVAIVEKQISASRANNQWYHYDETSDLVTIFVHGYISDAASCWTSRSGIFWPNLLVDDVRIPRTSIFLGGYYTCVQSRQYSVADCASELIKALRRADSSQRPPPLSKKNIVFVCHSLGGIVARYMLEAYRDDFEQKNVGLCLLASPSLGSAYATTFGALVRLLGNKVGRQLAFGSAFLEDLDDRFMRYINQKPTGTFWGAEGVEHNPPMLAWVPGFAPLVTKLSAARYFSERRTIPGTDHRTISKPTGLNHPSHEFLVDFFALQFSTQAQVRDGLAPIAEVTERRHRDTDVLFDAYEPAYEHYYVHRQIDEQIANQSQRRSLWLSGNSGYGKTCALKRFVVQSGFLRIDICLSQCQSDASRQDLINEMLQTLRQITGSLTHFEPTYQSLVNALIEVATNDLIVTIDEVPSGPGAEAAGELLSLLSELLITIRQRTNREVRFTVSSISPPNPGALQNPAKVAELFAFLHLSEWSNADLERLYHTVVLALPQLAFDREQIQALLLAAEGSPRFMKVTFLNLYAKPELAKSPEDAVRVTREQLGLKTEH